MNFNHHEEHLDTDINIVPIIDCLVMLICFMLFTAAFTQLVFLEAKLTANAAAAAEKSRSELDQFRMVVNFTDNGLLVNLTGSAIPGGKASQNLPMAKDGYDFKSLHALALDWKTRFPDRFSADIEIKLKDPNKLDYQNILMAIDSLRHLTDEEYGQVRTEQKKRSNMQLTDRENKATTKEELQKLSIALASNDVTKDTDPRLLFPDIALVGIN